MKRRDWSRRVNNIPFDYLYFNILENGNIILMCKIIVVIPPDERMITLVLHISRSETCHVSLFWRTGSGIVHDPCLLYLRECVCGIGSDGSVE